MLKMLKSELQQKFVWEITCIQTMQENGSQARWIILTYPNKNRTLNLSS